MKKIIKRLHLILAIPAGLFVTLICATGAVLVFQTEITEALHPERYFVNDSSFSGQPRLTLDSIEILVNQQLIGDTVKSIRPDIDTTRNIVAALVSGHKMNAYVDPYTGLIIEINNGRTGFFHQTMTLHRWLMMRDRAVGKIIVGISTICLIIVMITGVMRWYRSRKFTIKWRTKSTYRRVLDVHRVAGAYIAVILIVMALTGLMWSFGWYRSAVVSIFGIQEIAPLMKLNYAIHVGSWGGVATKILWFIAALVGAALPVTGYILWLKRLVSKKS